MTTVFSVHNSDGCVGRCDARCHEAEGDECHCICGGAFHGVGSKIARADRNFLTEAEILENCEKLYPDVDLLVLRRDTQLELFEL